MRRLAVLLGLGVVVLYAVVVACPNPEGVPHFSIDARNALYDGIFTNATSSDKTFILANWPRVLISFPCFATSCDNFAASWYHNGLVYKDGVSTGNSSFTLKNLSNVDMCINFPLNCNPCGQKIMDPGSASAVADWESALTTLLATAGGNHKGFLMDDMNDDLNRVSECSGGGVCDPNTGTHCPKDPRTGLAMTNENWRKYLATFAEHVRATFPSEEIWHNPVFFLGSPDSDQYIDRRVRASNGQSMERGVIGSPGGAGPTGIESYWAYVDQCHARGVATWNSPNSGSTNTAALREYNLAAWMMTSNGFDYVGSQPEGGTVTDYWAGFLVNLGNATGARFQRGDMVWERDFTNGKAYVNEPGAATHVVNLGGTFHRIDGSTATSISLAAAQGAVVFP